MHRSRPWGSRPPALKVRCHALTLRRPWALKVRRYTPTLRPGMLSRTSRSTPPKKPAPHGRAETQAPRRRQCELHLPPPTRRALPAVTGAS